MTIRYSNTAKSTSLNGPRGIGGGTVAAFFRQQGLPAAVWMTVSQTAHQPNEFCLLSNLVGDARVLAHVFLEEE